MKCMSLKCMNLKFTGELFVMKMKKDAKLEEETLQKIYRSLKQDSLNIHHISDFWQY